MKLSDVLMAEEGGDSAGGTPAAPAEAKVTPRALHEEGDLSDPKNADLWDDSNEEPPAQEPPDEPAPEPEPPPEQTPPQDKPTSEPVAKPVEQAAPVPAPAAKQPEAAPPPPPATGPTPPTAEEQTQRRQQFRESLQKHYDSILSEDDRNALMTDPATVVPKMMAEAHMQIVDATIWGVMQELPNIIRGQQQRMTQQQQDEQEFFGKYPELNSAEGRAAATRIAAAYLGANPAVKREIAIQEIGMLSRQALGLNAPAQGGMPMAPPTPAPAGAPSAPSRPKQPKSQESVFYEEVANEDGRG